MELVDGGPADHDDELDAEQDRHDDHQRLGGHDGLLARYGCVVLLGMQLVQLPATREHNTEEQAEADAEEPLAQLADPVRVGHDVEEDQRGERQRRAGGEAAGVEQRVLGAGADPPGSADGDEREEPEEHREREQDGEGGAAVLLDLHDAEELLAVAGEVLELLEDGRADLGRERDGTGAESDLLRVLVVQRPAEELAG